jgi:hypothetical protein
MVKMEDCRFVILVWGKGVCISEEHGKGLPAGRCVAESFKRPPKLGCFLFRINSSVHVGHWLPTAYLVPSMAS